VESLQRIVQNAPSHEAMRDQAAAEGFDPDFVDEVMKRVRGEANKNFIQRRVSTKEISEALLGLLHDTDDADGDVRGSRAMIWHQAREAIKKSGEKIGLMFSEIDDAIMEELQGLYITGALTKLGDAKLAMWRPVLEARINAHDNLVKVSEEITTWLKQAAGAGERQLEAVLKQVAGKEAESAPWKVALAMAFSKTEKGKRGEDPTAEDIADMFLQLNLLEQLIGEIAHGPEANWAWALHTQSQMYKAHQHVGDALLDLHEQLAAA
jgi:hypothetical protein